VAFIQAWGGGGNGMNRRRVMVGAGLVVLAGVSALAAPGLFTRSRNEGKVTLRSRILEYEDRLETLDPFPRTESIKADIIAMLGEYFHIGMSYDECIRLLEENDLKVDERYTDERDYRFQEQKIYFNPAIVSVINLPTINPLVSFQYRLVLRFHQSKLDQISASRVGIGP